MAIKSAELDKEQPVVPPSVVVENDAYDPRWTEVDRKIESIEVQLKAFEGKDGHNPFLWKKQNDWENLKEAVKRRNTNILSVVEKMPSVVIPKVDYSKTLPLYGGKK